MPGCEAMSDVHLLLPGPLSCPRRLALLCYPASKFTAGQGMEHGVWLETPGGRAGPAVTLSSVSHEALELKIRTDHLTALYNS